MREPLQVHFAENTTKILLYYNDKQINVLVINAPLKLIAWGNLTS